MQRGWASHCEILAYRNTSTGFGPLSRAGHIRTFQEEQISRRGAWRYATVLQV